MSNIKVRAWDESEKKILDWNLLSQTAWNRGLSGSLLYEVLVGSSSRYTPMQYIGRKDTHGRELYESDIVSVHIFGFNGSETEHEFIGVIERCEESCSFGIRVIKNISTNMNNGEIHPIPIIYGIHEESFNLIGNTYNNPEILKAISS